MNHAHTSIQEPKKTIDKIKKLIQNNILKCMYYNITQHSESYTSVYKLM